MSNIQWKDSVYRGDCIEVMDMLPMGVADFIFCDLPYGITQNKWDSIIDLNLLWPLFWKILKPNGCIALFSAQPFTTKLIQSQIEHYKYEWVWVKNLKTGNLNARNRPMGGHETVQIFYKARPVYNPQMRNRTIEQKSGNKKNSKTSNYGKQAELLLDRQSEFINPDTVLTNFKCVHNSSGKLHPTQKPVELLEYFIRTYTNEGDTVADFTAGSLSTAEAAIKSNRHYIMVEKDPEIFSIGVKRLNKILSPLSILT